VDYAAVINRTPIHKSRVVPYVWDSCFIQQYGTNLLWTPPAKWETQDIVITDPSISFQKCSFYSVLLVEAFAKEHPEWKGKLHIVNGDRLKLSANAFNKFVSGLQMYKTNRMVLYPRKKINQIMTDHRSACFITHQWNNDYNYSTLELMYCQYPVVHNSVGWSEYGYYYSLDEWEKAIDVLANAMKHHASNRYNYQSHASQLIWKHSIHHPEVQKEWKQIID
jgi:sRNA-binding regulator protein Hfq